MEYLLIPLFFLSFVIYPAWVFYRNLILTKDNDLLIEIFFYFVIGFMQLTAIALLIRLLGLPFSATLLLPLFALICHFFSWKKQKGISLKKKVAWPKMAVSTIIVGVILQNIVLFRGGFKGQEGFYYPSMHDTMWNIAIGAELMSNFPPQHPGYSGISLKNNHYLYPFLLALTGKLTGASMTDLYFRVYPPIVSLLFGLGLYTVVSIFLKNGIFRANAVFLGYFSGSLAYFLPLFYGNKFNWQGNTFLSDQPFDQLINPYSVFGFTLMLFSIFIFHKIFTDDKNRYRFLLPLSLSSGFLYGFKSFGGIVVVLSLLTIFVIIALLKKKIWPIYFTLGVLCTFIPVFLLITQANSAQLMFMPGWILTEMMIKQDGLNLPRFAQVESYYQSTGNYLGLIKYKLIGFSIYIIGNLGVRLIGLFFLIMVLFKKRREKTQTGWLFFYIFLLSGISLMLPLLFNLGANAHNIVQFTPYALVLFSLLTGIALERIHQYFIQYHRPLSGWLVILFVILLAIPVNIKNIIMKIPPSSSFVSFAESTGLVYMREKLPHRSVVLADINQYDHDPIYIAALSERKLYLASQGYAVQTGQDSRDRWKFINDYFHGDIPQKEALIKRGITHIYLLKPYKDTYLLKAEREGLINLFENEKVIILEVK